MREIDVVGNMAESSIRFILNTVLWENFDSCILDIISSNQSWAEVKLLDKEGYKNPQLSTLPDNKGGIYLINAY